MYNYFMSYFPGQKQFDLLCVIFLLSLAIKHTSYVLGRKQQNLQLMDILADKNDHLLAELQARSSRSCRFCRFLPHT